MSLIFLSDRRLEFKAAVFLIVVRNVVRKFIAVVDAATTFY